MKKPTLALGLVILAAGLLGGAPLLRLDKPNGGETLAPGSAFDICWTASGVTQNVKLILLQNGAIVGTIASDLAPGGSPFRWTVGATSGGSAQAGGGFAVRIKTMDGSLLDVSDGTFTIGGQSAAPFLKVTFPVGGETFTWGGLQPFQWKATHVSGNVRVVLLRNGSPVHELSPSVSAAAGAVGWTIGNAPGWSCATHCGGGYKLRVEALDGSASAESPNTFSIAAAPSAGGGEPDFELTALDRYFVWKPDPVHGGEVLTLAIYIHWYNHGADYQGPLKVHYMYMDALQKSKISKDAVLEIPSVAIAHNTGRKDFLCTVEKIPAGVKSISFAAMLDPDNQVGETNEKNNYRDLSVELNPQPDLAIEDVRYSTSEFHNDDPVDVYFTVRNRGIEPARQFSVRIELEDEKGNFLGYRNSMTIPVLGGCNDTSGPASHLPVHFQMRFTDEVPHSGLFVIHVDYDDRVREANEKNNKSWRKYYLLPTADLSFSQVKAWQERMKLHVQFRVANTGFAAADGAFAYVKIMSADEHNVYNDLRGKIDLGWLNKGTDTPFAATIEVTWPKGAGKYLVQFYIADCCRFEGKPGNDRYHDLNPNNNKAETWVKWED